jgi:hypothetical protein
MQGPRLPKRRQRLSLTIARIADRTRIAALIAGAIATCQPVNFEERLAVERMALANRSICRPADDHFDRFQRLRAQAPARK